jgi:hypothetical protein
MSRLENDQRRRDASLREYRQHLEMIDTISRNGKTRTQREQEDRQAAIAHFKELWSGWEMPSGTGKAEEVTCPSHYCSQRFCFCGIQGLENAFSLLQPTVLLL